MYNIFYSQHSILYRKVICAFVAFTFVLSLAVPPSIAQLLPPTGAYLANLPAPGQSIWLTPVFQPPVLRGMTVHPENPLLFDFIVDRGQDKIQNEELKAESEKLIKYFLASMTIPDKDAWVNLSPYESDRIIPDALGQTEMGRQMLEQDYILKQLSASLTNPDTELGKKYWDEVERRTTTVERSTFNKVWIVPDGATVVEKDGFAFITESKLKVMLDEDYLAQQQSVVGSRWSEVEEQTNNTTHHPPSTTNQISQLSSQVFREIILPKLIEEVNTGKNFAQTRQVYQSVILAAWYKKALKDSLLGRIYADKSKVEGVETDIKDIKQKVYDQYLEAFKKGAYNVIKEEDNGDDLIPRKYFSGGLELYFGSGAGPLRIRDDDASVQTALLGVVRAGSQVVSLTAGMAEPSEVATLAASAAKAKQVSAASSPMEEIKKSLVALTIGLLVVLSSPQVGAVSNNFAQIYMQDQKDRGNNLSLEGARREIDFNLDKILNTYAQLHGGKLVPDSLKDPMLQDILNGARSFDEVRQRLQKAAAQIGNNTYLYAKLQESTLRWVYSWFRESSTFDTVGAKEIIRKLEQGQKPYSTAESASNLKHYIGGNIRYQGTRTIICDNATKLVVATLADTGLWQDDEVSEMKITRNYKGVRHDLVGHVAVMYKLKTGKHGFFDAVQGETDLFGNSKVNENIDLKHQEIYAQKRATGKFERVVVKGSDLGNYVGITVSGLIKLGGAQLKLRALIDAINALSPAVTYRLDSPQLRQDLLHIQSLFKTLITDPYINEDEKFKERLNKVEAILNQIITNAGQVEQRPKTGEPKADLLLGSFYISFILEARLNSAKQLFNLGQSDYLRKLYGDINRTAIKTLSQIKTVPNDIEITIVEKNKATGESIGSKDITAADMASKLQKLIDETSIWLKSSSSASTTSAASAVIETASSGIIFTSFSLIGVLNDGMRSVRGYIDEFAVDNFPLVYQFIQDNPSMTVLLVGLGGGMATTLLQKLKESLDDSFRYNLGKFWLSLDPSQRIMDKLVSRRAETVPELISLLKNYGIRDDKYFYIIEMFVDIFKDIEKDRMGDDEKVTAEHELLRHFILVLNDEKETINHRVAMADALGAISDVIAIDHIKKLEDSDPIKVLADLVSRFYSGGTQQDNKVLEQAVEKALLNLLSKAHKEYADGALRTLGIDPESIGMKTGKHVVSSATVMTPAVASTQVTPGGIDFDPSKLNLQIKRDGRGVPLPLPQQDLLNIDIKGLYPVIINIMPINVQTLPILGQLNVQPDVALSKS